MYLHSRKNNNWWSEKYYKELNTDGTLSMIGTQDALPEDAVEITEQEYTELYQYIQENAVHIVEEDLNYMEE